MATVRIELPDDLINHIEDYLKYLRFAREHFFVQALEKELEYQEKIKELIDNFEQKIEDWEQKCPNDHFIFNKDLRSFNGGNDANEMSVDWNGIRYIMVGDNPGDKEKRDGRYLVSEQGAHTSSGNIAKEIFEYIGIQRNEYIVLNKCPIYTSETAQLNGKCLLQETQEYMAELTFKLTSVLVMDVKFTFSD